MSLAECGMQENTDFESFYFNVFFNIAEIYSPFNYTIQNEGSYQVLIVTNLENNQAHYTSVNLSAKDFEESKIKVKTFPNPIKDPFFVNIQER